MTGCLICRNSVQEKLSLGKIFSFYAFPKKYCCDSCSKLFQATETAENWLKNPVYVSLNQYDHTTESDRLLCYLEVHAHQLRLYQNTDFFRDWLYRYQVLGDYELGKVMNEQLYAFFSKNKESMLFPMPIPYKKYEKIGYNPNESLLDFAQIPYIVINNQQEKKRENENTFYIMDKSTQKKRGLADLADRSILLFALEGEEKTGYQAVIDLCLEQKARQLVLITLV